MLNKEQEAFMIKLAGLVEELTKRVDFISNQLINKANEVNQKFEPGFAPDGKLEEISLVKEKEVANIEINFTEPKTIEYHIAISKALMNGIIKVCEELKIGEIKINYNNKKAEEVK